MEGEDFASYWWKCLELDNNQATVQESTVYLIAQCPGTSGKPCQALRELSDEMFVEKLAGWFTDTTTGPQDRSFDVFRRWFEFHHHFMLVDLCREPLTSESD